MPKPVRTPHIAYGSTETGGELANVWLWHLLLEFGDKLALLKRYLYYL
jgi:hypothetical protein